MAWSIVGTAAPLTVASGNVTATEPSGAQQGDLMIVSIAYRGNVGFTLPTGWSLVEQQNTGDLDATSGIASGLMAYIVRGASTPDLVFTRTGGDVAVSAVAVYRGNHASPLGGHTSTTMESSSTMPQTTGTITTAADNSLLVGMVACGDAHTVTGFVSGGITASDGNNLLTDPPSTSQWRDRIGNSTGIGADCGLGTADAIKATAGNAFGLTASTSGNSRQAIIFAEFKIAASAPTGSLNSTLAAVTSSATGKLSIKGSTSATLAPATSSGTAKLANDGALTTALSDATLASAGALAISGALTATLSDASLNATGALRPHTRGSVDAALAAATLAAAGTLDISGALSLTLDATTLSASGQLGLQGALAGTLSEATLAASGMLAIKGSATATLADATVNGTGDLGGTLSGSLDVTLASATISASGALDIDGALNATLADATLAGSGQLGRIGALTTTLADATLTAEGDLLVAGVTLLTLEDATLVATGTGGNTGALTTTLDAATLSASGSLDLSGALNVQLGNALLNATGTSAITGELTATLDHAVLGASGRNPNTGVALVINWAWRARGWLGAGRDKGRGIWRR